MLREHSSEACRLTAAGSDELGIRLFRKASLERVEVRYEHRHELFGRSRNDVDCRMLGDMKSVRRDHCQLFDPMTLLACKLGGHISAHRQADKVERIDLEHLEQIEIMHDIVLHFGERRIVSGLAKARMIWNNNTKPVGPDSCKFENVDGAGAMKQNQRFAFARCVNDSLHTFDGEFLAYELTHYTPHLTHADSVSLCFAFPYGFNASGGGPSGPDDPRNILRPSG